jgi:hypothetical protein
LTVTFLTSLFILAYFQEPPAFQFTEITEEAGLAFRHGYTDGEDNDPRRLAGGVAVGDYDGDGWTDIYLVGGAQPNRLYRNQGNGTFVDVTAAAGVALEGHYGSGPHFADYDGDGDLDLLVGGIEGSKPTLMRNLGNGTFQDVTAQSGIVSERNTYSCAYGDYDLDGDLDLFLSHWGMEAPTASKHHLWRNNGDGTFTNVDDSAGITNYDIKDFSFTPNFADINNDGYPDLVISGDFNTSKIFINQGDGTFVHLAEQVLSDENGMGGAVGDYDNDGDLDWFVSSIYGGPDSTLFTGNRLYRNRGDGTFDEVTESSGVRHGFWGWGSSFVDLNHDGYLDLAHTNGWFGDDRYEFTPSRIFISQTDGTFAEQAYDLGIRDNGQGRGIACFDFDRDGDMDILISNILGNIRFYRNDGGNTRDWLMFRLRDNTANTEAVGARIYVTAGGITQMREIRSGNNYVSQDAAEAHFGIPDKVESLRVRWPDGTEAEYAINEVNRTLTIRREYEHRQYVALNPEQVLSGSALTIIQPEQTETAIELVAIDSEGTILRRGLPALRPGGLNRIELGELFGTLSFNWIMIQSDQPVRAYLEGRGENEAFALPTSATLSERLIVPHIAADTEQFYTQANFVNGSSSSIATTLTTPDALPRTLPLENPLSGTFFDFETLLAGDLTPGRNLAVVEAADGAGSLSALAGTELFGYKNSERLAGLTLTGTTSRSLIFSHIASVANGWWTGVALTNPNSEPVTLQVRGYDESGTEVASGTQTMGAGDKITALIDPNNRGEALSPSGFPSQTAWILVESDLPITGYELFGDLSGGRFAGFQAGTGYVEEMILPYSGDDQNYAGIALVGAESQTVTLILVNSSGTEVERVTLSLGSRARYIGLVSQIFSQQTEQGYVRVEGPMGIHGFLLYGPNDASWLCGLNGLTQ